MSKIMQGLEQMLLTIFNGKADESEMTFTLKGVPFKLTLTKNYSEEA